MLDVFSLTCPSQTNLIVALNVAHVAINYCLKVSFLRGCSEFRRTSVYDFLTLRPHVNMNQLVVFLCLLSLSGTVCTVSAAPCLQKNTNLKMT